MKSSTVAPLSDRINNWIYSSFIITSLFFSSQETYAQISENSVTVRGTVRAFSDSTALAGVNVSMKGGFIFTETDSAGRFELMFKGESIVDTLEFSFPGFINEKRAWESKELIVYMDSILVPLAGRIGCLVAYRWWDPRQIWWKMKRAFRKK